MQQETFPEFIETTDDALKELVKHLGGFKKVGARMFPEDPAERAGNKLRDMLNPERREKLSIDQGLLLLRWAREAGFHGAMHYVCFSVGYQNPAPLDPEDEAQRLQREFVSAVDKLAAIQAQLGRAVPAKRRG